MNTRGRVLLALCLCMVPLCFAAPTYQTISFDGLYATLVEPDPYQLTLAPLNINDPRQQWILDADGYISNKLYPDQVFDVPAFSTTPGTKVGLWTKKPLTENPTNQLWDNLPNGALKSRLAPNYFLHPIANYPPPGTSITVDYWNPPKIPLMEDVQPFVPLTCSSTGDPHIVPFGGGYARLNTPGVQEPGPFVLAVFGETRVVANHALCGCCAYCNTWISVEQGGSPAAIVTGDAVTFNNVPTTVTGTQTLAPDMSITRHGNGDYTITVPCATIDAKMIGAGPFANYYITINCGPYPDGGLCFVEESRKRFDLAAHIAKNKITSMCDSPLHYDSIDDWEAANPDDFPTNDGNATTDDPLLLANATLLCSPLQTGPLVTQCGAILPPDTYHQSCKDDVIFTGDFSVAAAIVDGYAIQCAKRDPNVVLPASGAYTIAFGPGLGDANGRVPLNRQTNFTIQARDALRRLVTIGGDSFKVSVASGPLPHPTFTVQDHANGLYSVLYTPTVAGAYTLDVKLRGLDAIIDSPFSFTVVSFATDLAQSTLTGTGLVSPVRAGPTQTFEFQAKTSWGENQPLPGDLVSVAVSGSSSHTVAFQGSGRYVVTYRQNAIGTFTIAVTINGQPFPGSPFTLQAN